MKAIDHGRIANVLKWLAFHTPTFVFDRLYVWWVDREK